MNSEGSLLASSSWDRRVKIYNKSLYSLARLPIQQLLKHITCFEQKDNLTPNQRCWIEFILALANRSRRFDIGVEEVLDAIALRDDDIYIEE
jgi:hypothetical protein